MASKSRILNNTTTDPNKMLPINYKWARQHYKDGVANNWVPEEVNMQNDVEQWKSKKALTDDERRLIMRNMGFFSTAESLTANNIVLTVYKHVTNPECRQYLLRQAYEEAIHTDAFIYSCDTLGLNPDEVYTMYNDIPSIKAKDDFVIDMTKSLLDPAFTTVGIRNMQRFVHDIVGYYIIMEGIFFYAGFAMMLSMMRQGKMVGVGEQFQFILRDESIHLDFGRDLINTIVQENPKIWTKTFKNLITENIKKGVELEKEYTADCLPTGILGLTAGVVSDYVEYIADKRLESIKLPFVYKTKNPFPWISEMMDLKKEKNFFETRVTEYKVGALEW
jgi:ribonucleoside-diphosphate reductase beta chain